MRIVMHRFPLGWLVCSILLVMAMQPLNAGDDVMEKLRAFEQRVNLAAKDGASPQAVESMARAAGVIKLVRTMIERDQSEKVERILGSNEIFGLPANLQTEWIELFQSLMTQVDAIRAANFEKWAAQVDDLAKGVRQRCLDAKTSAELDPLLVRCAALQMQRLGQDNVVGQRAARRMAGVASTLENWANFLDFRAAGNATAANDILRKLSSDTSQIPILTLSDIQEHYMQAEGNGLTMRDALERVLGPLKTPDDLPGALDRIQRLGGSLPITQLQTLQLEKTRIQMLQSAWEALKKGDEDGALKWIERVGKGGGLEDANPYYERIKAGIVEPIMISRMKKWTDLQPLTGEAPSVYVLRVVDQLYSKGDFAAVAEVMALGEQLLRISTRIPTLLQDRAMIDRYLAAKRFESVGDVLSAVNEYRNVFGVTGGKYAPTKQIGEALQRLKEKHPEVFNDYEGAVLAELRALRQQVQFLMSRPLPGQMNTPFGR